MIPHRRYRHVTTLRVRYISSSPFLRRRTLGKTLSRYSPADATEYRAGYLWLSVTLVLPAAARRFFRDLRKQPCNYSGKAEETDGNKDN